MDGYTVKSHQTRMKVVLKNCTTCGTPKPLDQFNKGRAYCKPCHSAAALAWAMANREKRRAIANAYTKRRREVLGPPKKAGRPTLYSAEQYTQKMREWRKDWASKNPAKLLARTRRYQAQKLKAIPRWADHKAIAQVYESARLAGMHVDHIVPLVSPIVCGLHCEANLQLLTPHENWSKNNRHWPDMP